MSKLILLVFISFALGPHSFAAVDCENFKREKNEKSAELNNFNNEVDKLYQKAQKLRERVYERMDAVKALENKVSLAQGQRDSAVQQRQDIAQNMDTLEAELSFQRAQEQRLLAQMEDAQRRIDSHPPGSQARREAMRDYKRAQKALERAQGQIQMLLAQLAPMQEEKRVLNQKIQSSSQEIQALRQDMEELKNQKPSISFLQEKIAQVEDQIFNSDATLESLKSALKQAEEKILMCATYNQKYPLVLSLAREIIQIGCKNYQFKPFEDLFEREAQDEIFSSMCE